MWPNDGLDNILRNEFLFVNQQEYTASIEKNILLIKKKKVCHSNQNSSFLYTPTVANEYTCPKEFVAMQ